MATTENKTPAKKKTTAKKSATKKSVSKKPASKKSTAVNTKKTRPPKKNAPVLSALTENTNTENDDETWLENKLSSMARKRVGKKEVTSEKNGREDENYVEKAAMARGDIPKSIVEHLTELRSRLVIILGLFMALTVAAFFLSEPIVDFINGPFLQSGEKLNMLKFMGGFLIRLKAAALIALLIMIPIIIFHLWRFTVPALEKETRRFSLIVILSAIVLFYGGAAFVFFLLVPLMVPIMMGFIPSSMNATIDAESYLSFVILITISMGVLFEMPILVLILTRIGVISPQFLISKRKYAIVINFIIAAFVTPQDALSIFFVAIPLVFLYEVSIILSKFMVKRANK